MFNDFSKHSQIILEKKPDNINSNMKPRLNQINNISASDCQRKRWMKTQNKTNNKKKRIEKKMNKKRNVNINVSTKWSIVDQSNAEAFKVDFLLPILIFSMTGTRGMWRQISNHRKKKRISNQLSLFFRFFSLILRNNFYQKKKQKKNRKRGWRKIQINATKSHKKRRQVLLC